MLEFRHEGIKLLRPFIKNDINLVETEKYVFLASRTKEEYYRNLYESIGDILLGTKHGIPKDDTVQGLLYTLNNRLFDWEHPVYNEYARLEREYLDFLTCPVHVQEGVLQCGKCKSKRTLSYAKQTRAADEPTSIFAQCVDCGNQWREN